MRQLLQTLKLIGPIVAIAVVALTVDWTQAAPLTTTAPAPSSASGGLFAGSFEGYLTGSRGSRAPITLDLSQSGNTVTGDIVIGRGLVVDGGVCGLAAVPAGTQSAAGQVSGRNPRHLDAGTALTVQGMAIKIDLDGDLSRDGKTLTAASRIDLPWLCGADPVIQGTLERAG